MTNKTLKTKMRIILIETIFIGFLAATFLNVSAYLFSIATELPQSNFGLLGRWLNMLLHARFTTGSIISEPAVNQEIALGILGHLIISFMFAFFYLLACINHFIRAMPPLVSGLACGLVLILFPLLIEYPAMSIHIFDDQWPYITLGSMRMITCHLFFGIGLGLGRIWMEYIRTARVSTNII